MLIFRLVLFWAVKASIFGICAFENTNPITRSDFRGPESMILQPPDDADEDAVGKKEYAEINTQIFGSYTHALMHERKCHKRNLLSCSVECDHHKVYMEHGCCKCVCFKNYFIIASTRCRRASWSKWSYWSKCLKSKWGGLQTRERICKFRDKEKGGVCEGRGSISRTCSPVTEAFRIRKNVRHLSGEDIHDLIQSMTEFKKDQSEKGFMNIASWHGFPGRCPWNKMYKGHENNHCSWHHHPLFLPWHRMLIVQFELGLQKYLKNKTLGIPYWDWTEEARDIPYLIRHPEIYDPILKKFVHNPFYNTQIPFHNKTFTRRHIWYPGVLMKNFFQKATTRALLSHNYFNFDSIISTYSHDQIHNCFCYKSQRSTDPDDWCNYSMSYTPYSAFDPVFILHHSAIDRVFSMRRHLEESAGLSDWTSSRVTSQVLKGMKTYNNPIKHSFEWPLSPFCNKTLNPEAATRNTNVWTLHRSYYGEQLFGYEYADFDLGDYSWKDLKDDFKNNNFKRTYWNDDVFTTKFGSLGKNICMNPKYDNASGCYFSC